MKKTNSDVGFLQRSRDILLPLAFLGFLISCSRSIQNPESAKLVETLSKSERSGDVDQARINNFQQVNLVDNNGEYNALHKDPILMNAWGLAFTSNGIAWLSSEAGHVSTVYDKEGNTLRPPVTIPSPGSGTGGSPTGVVLNPSTTDFKLSNGAAARFIFVGDDGVISGWNPTAGNNALLIKNNAATSVYTGVTIAMNQGSNFLYAANFRTRRIDVFDKNFSPVHLSFTDRFLPAGYSPFNIQVVAGMLFVMYAKVGPDGDEQKGHGNGFVDIFNTNGKLIERFASRGSLNAPWGVAMAPAGFFITKDDKDRDDHKGDEHGKYHDAREDSLERTVILVGNFGDGRINAFNGEGEFLGELRMQRKPIVIDGLWALSFPPPTATTIDPNRLYFTAGPDDEKDGLFGYLIKSPISTKTVW